MEELKEKLRKFLHGEDLLRKLRRLAATGQKSLVVEFDQLLREDMELARNLIEDPSDFLEAADLILTEITKIPNMRMRVKGLTETLSIRNIRAEHVGKFIQVDGILTRASEIKPEIREAVFRCLRCGEENRVIQIDEVLREPLVCENPNCSKRGPFKLEVEGSEFRDWQSLRIQERPEELRGGKMPRQLDCIVKDDFVDKAVPGNHVQMTGILRVFSEGLGRRQRRTTFLKILFVNHIEVLQKGVEEVELSLEDEAEIRELAKDPDFREKIIASIAPSIYGYREVKEGIALQLFGSNPIELADGTRVRGDMHVLLTGDPGVAKCLRGDTLVVLGDGSLRRIRDIVESEMEGAELNVIEDGFFKFTNHDVLTLDNHAKLMPGKANILWKREAPAKLVKVQTFSGREIVVTPTHPFFVCEDGEISQLQAEELKVGLRIATPRRIPVFGEPQPLLTTQYRLSRSKNKVNFNPPASTSPAFWRFIAMVISESYIQVKDASAALFFTNNDEALLQEFEKSCRQLGLHPSRIGPRRGKRAKEIVVSSIEFISFLEALGIKGKSGEKKVPELLFKCSKPEIAAFLQGIIDCEARVGKRTVEITGASRTLIKQLQHLLLRFGILSQLHSMKSRASNSPKPTLKEYYRLNITDRSSIGLLVREIGSTVKEKRESLELAASSSTVSPNLDLIPGVFKRLKELRSKLRLRQRDCGITRSGFAHLERGERLPSRDTLLKICEAFRKRLMELSVLAQRGIRTWRELKLAREGARVSQEELSRHAEVSQTLISQYERGKIGLCKKLQMIRGEQTLEKVAKALKGIISRLIDNDLIRCIDKLEVLARSDIFWDKIKSIDVLESDEKWIYDLQVQGAHNYVANDVCVHNSQILKWVSLVAPRGLYTSGKKTTPAGLTATAVRDEIGGGWTLEAGALVIADGGLACVPGDTRVFLSDGSRPTIESLFRRFANCNPVETFPNGSARIKLNGEIEALCFDGSKITKAEVKYIWRNPLAKKILKLKTELGTEIKVTDDHLIPIWRDAKIVWKLARTICENDYVVLPRDLPSGGFIPFICDMLSGDLFAILAEDHWETLWKSLRSRYGSIRKGYQELGIPYWVYNANSERRSLKIKYLRKIVENLGLNKEEIYRDIQIHAGSRSVPIRLPLRVTREIMEIAGMVFSDGHLTTKQFEIYNSDESFLDRFRELVKSTFGLTSKDYIRESDKSKGKIRRKVNNVRCYVLSKVVASLLSGLGIPRGNKSTEKKLHTDIIDKLPNDYIASFLRGCFDGDGGVSRRKSRKWITYVIHFTTGLRENAETYRYYLWRLGIPSYIEQTEQGTYNVLIFNRSNCQKFSEEIGTNVHFKKEGLAHMLKIKDFGDKIPGLGKLIKEMRKELRIGRRSISGIPPSTLHYYENDIHPIPRGALKKIVVQCRNNSSGWKELISIANSGIRFARVARIEELPHEEKWIYDLTTQVNYEPNFIAEYFIIHNSIDEFDKMSDEDRSAIVESLEQQTISVAKAGIVATLNTRTAVLSAANPRGGRFDRQRLISEQIALEPVILSRFDLIFVMRDEPYLEWDRTLAQHILKLHKDPTQAVKPPFDAEALRKIIIYARKYLDPKIKDKEVLRIIEDFYVRWRGIAAGGTAPIPITPRQLESIIRLAKANARMRLSDEVTVEDASRAIKLVKYFLSEAGVDTETGKIDVDVLMTGKSRSQRERIARVWDIIRELEGKYGGAAPLEEIIKLAESEGMSRKFVEGIIEYEMRQGHLYQPRDGFVSTVVKV